MAKEDIITAILQARPHRNEIVAERFTHSKGTVAEEDLAGVINLADDIIRVVENGWQVLWKRGWAEQVTADGRLHL